MRRVDSGHLEVNYVERLLPLRDYCSADSPPVKHGIVDQTPAESGNHATDAPRSRSSQSAIQFGDNSAADIGFAMK